MRIWAVLILLASPLHSADHASISGKVVNAEGSPVDNATVLIYKAAVKTGYSTYCPTCYVDCGKHVLTSSDGTFEIGGLSQDLLFTLLVIHDGHATATVERVDPEKGIGGPVTIKPRIPVEDNTRTVLGRVVDLQGHALRNAVVEQQGVIFASGGQAYGAGGWTDIIAVTNDQGEFEMAYGKTAQKLILSVAARGMAPKLFTEPTGADRKTMAVAEGATVHGRLLYRGKPVPSAEVGLMTHNRRSGTGYPEVRIGTQDDGTFAITNVPSGRIWMAYPKMESLAERGLAGAPVALETKDDGEDVNIGDIELAPAHKLAGQVELADGKPVPPGMRMMLNADQAWDTQIILLPADGRFEFKGLATGVYSLSPALRGYELAEGFEQEILINHDRSVTVQLKPKLR